MEGGGAVVKLNIGGKKFVTTAATLTQHSNEENFFTRLLSGRVPSAKVDGDFFFVDRNGRYFEPLLDFLRTGKLRVPEYMKPDREMVMIEADFYGIKLFPHLSDESIKTTIQEQEEHRRLAVLAKYNKAACFVQDQIGKYFHHQLGHDLRTLRSSRICLQPMLQAREIVTDRLVLDQFDTLVKQHGVVFCEEAVALEDMSQFVDGLIWDFKTNAGLSLAVLQYELKFIPAHYAGGLVFSTMKPAGPPTRGVHPNNTRPVYEFTWHCSDT